MAKQSLQYPTQRYRAPVPTATASAARVPLTVQSAAPDRGGVQNRVMSPSYDTCPATTDS